LGPDDLSPLAAAEHPGVLNRHGRREGVRNEHGERRSDDHSRNVDQSHMLPSVVDDERAHDRDRGVDDSIE